MKFSFDLSEDSSFDLSEVGTFSLSKKEVLENGVFDPAENGTINTMDDILVSSSSVGFKSANGVSVELIEGKSKTSLGIKFSAKLPETQLGDSKVEGTIMINSIKPDWSAKYTASGGLKSSHLILKMNGTASAAVKLGRKTTAEDPLTFQKGNKKIEKLLPLGTIPVPLFGVVTLNLGVYAKISVDGKVSVTFSYDTQFGARQNGRDITPVIDASASLDKIEFEAGIELGPELTAALSVCGTIRLIDAGCFIGGGVTGNVTRRSPTFSCIDATIYVPLSLKVGVDSLVTTLFDWSHTHTI